VERLMRQTGLQGAFMRKRRRCSTRRDPAATPAPDLVNRNFNSDPPDRLWVADISRIPTGEGALWLASVRDAFSRRVVGWKASDRADTELVLGALEYALWSRKVERERLVFHSDHGAQPRFKGSLQHPDSGGVDGTTTGLGGCGDRKAADAVAGSSAGGAA